IVYLFMFNTSGIFKKINYYLLASFIFSSLFITIYAQQKNITISEIVDDNNYLYKFGPSFDTGDEEFYDVDHENKLLLKEFTLSAWFNTNQTDFDNPAHIVNKGGFNSDNKGENMNYGIWLSTDGTLTGGFETDSGDDFQVVSDEKYNDGKWHFVVLGYNGSVLLSNIDNKDINSLIVDEEPDINGDQPLRIGANSLNKDKFFDGRIDEVRVWSRGLTNQEINNIYKHNNYDSDGQIIYLNFGDNGTDSNQSSNLEGIKGEEGTKGENLLDLSKYSISGNVSNATSTAAKTTTTVLPTTNATSTAAKTTTTVLNTTNETSTAAKTTTTVLHTTNATSTAAKTTTTVLPTTNATSTAAKTTTTVLPTTNATSTAAKTTTTVLPTTNATSTAAKTTSTVLPTTNATSTAAKTTTTVLPTTNATSTAAKTTTTVLPTTNATSTAAKTTTTVLPTTNATSTAAKTTTTVLPTTNATSTAAKTTTTVLPTTNATSTAAKTTTTVLPTTNATSTAAKTTTTVLPTTNATS